MGTHTGRKESNGTIYDYKVFSEKRHLNRHMVMCKKDFKCSVCGEEFVFELAFTRHMARYTVEYNYMGNVCDKSFLLKVHLNRHMARHTGEYKYICNVCDKGFLMKLHLDRHMIKHTDEYKYKCDVCGKGFIFESHLTTHIFTHTVKNKCNVCGKMFKKKKYLDKHNATSAHTKEQTKMSDSKSNVNEHLENKEVIKICEMESETVVVLEDRYVATNPLKIEMESEDTFTLGNDEAPALDPLKTENDLYEMHPDITIRGTDEDEAFMIHPVKTEHEYSNITTEPEYSNTTRLLVKEDHSVWNVASNLVTGKGIDSAGDKQNHIVKREEGFDDFSS